LLLVQIGTVIAYRDKKVVGGVFVRFRAPLQLSFLYLHQVYLAVIFSRYNEMELYGQGKTNGSK
jgi:hypothetical protein